MNNDPLYIKYKDSINKTIAIGAKYYNCITKERLIMCLQDMKDIIGLSEFNLYLIGKLNSSQPAPTWELELLCDGPIFCKDNLIELMKTIIDIGNYYNIYINIRHIDTVSTWNLKILRPKNKINILETTLEHIIPSSSYSLHQEHKNLVISRNYNQNNIQYYKARLISRRTESNICSKIIRYLENIELPLDKYITNCTFN